MKIVPSLRDRDGGEDSGFEESEGSNGDLNEGRVHRRAATRDLDNEKGLVDAPTRDLEDDRERIEGSMRK